MHLAQTLRKALELYPDKKAVFSEDASLTYSEFGRRCFGLARLLSHLGVGYQDRVSIIHPNSHRFLEAYYATALLGAILVPINTRLSHREMSFIASDSESKVLIVDAEFVSAARHVVSDSGVKTLVVAGDLGNVETPEGAVNYDEAISGEAAENFTETLVKDEDAAQIYYTSGTTGRPKGVVLTHKNVYIHALMTVAELHLVDKDVWLHAAPLFHLADAWATWAITWVGATHVCVRTFRPKEVLQTMQQQGVTITNMVPTMLNMLVNEPSVEALSFPNLRAILSGGAPIAPEVVRKIMKVFKCEYIQTYGMTETSPYLTMSILKENLLGLNDEEKFRFRAKTGRPTLAVDLRVVDDKGRDVPKDGESVGEIVVRGDTVTKGYWRLPEETERAIVDGWLHTGDLATIDREGYVNIVDRKKDMIITGGENVYSTEVENVLYTHPAVLECAVIGIPHEKWGEAVHAVCVLREGMKVTEDELILYCKKQMAHYKAPKSVEFVGSLPKTGSGKIAKKVLKEKYWPKK